MGCCANDELASSLEKTIAAELLADTAWFDEHLRRVRAATASRAAAFTAAVATHLPGVTCTEPTGGMFSWLRFPTDTAALLPRAPEHGVGFVPGNAFEVGVRQTHSARCCFASHPEPVIVEAVRRLARAAT